MKDHCVQALVDHQELGCPDSLLPAKGLTLYSNSRSRLAHLRALALHAPSCTFLEGNAKLCPAPESLYTPPAPRSNLDKHYPSFETHLGRQTSANPPRLHQLWSCTSSSATQNSTQTFKSMCVTALCLYSYLPPSLA